MRCIEKFLLSSPHQYINGKQNVCDSLKNRANDLDMCGFCITHTCKAYYIIGIIYNVYTVLRTGMVSAFRSAVSLYNPSPPGIF